MPTAWSPPMPAGSGGSPMPFAVGCRPGPRGTGSPAICATACAGWATPIRAGARDPPALAGPRGVRETAEDGDELILDADDAVGAGQVILRPEQEVRQAYHRALGARSARQAGWAALRDRPAATRDGTAVC